MSKYKEFTDVELLKSISKFDSRALEELYDRYSCILYTLTKKIAPDQETTENILVDVFSIIWKKAEKLDFEKASVFTWLISLARNKAIDVVRRSRSSEMKLDPYDDKYENYFIVPTLSSEIDSLDLESAVKFTPKVERALSKLTDAQKYVIHLAFYEGYTLDEIADKLNIPIDTVRSKILTALNIFKDNLAVG
ncbi:MAG: hypothetical protein A2V66_03915 [Ignavibacteria bacterium RBG_13_36_8]|nr:MAG: hypothetical protein A2V66_03915 [Ignavibacteria bacterium RBG_13_36_8]